MGDAMNDFEKAMALVLSEGLDTIEQLTDEQLTEALEKGLFGDEPNK
jgi:hypothetical protein